MNSVNPCCRNLDRGILHPPPTAPTLRHLGPRLGFGTPRAARVAAFSTPEENRAAAACHPKCQAHPPGRRMRRVFWMVRRGRAVFLEGSVCAGGSANMIFESISSTRVENQDQQRSSVCLVAGRPAEALDAPRLRAVFGPAKSERPLRQAVHENDINYGRFCCVLCGISLGPSARPVRDPGHWGAQDRSQTGFR